MKKIIVFSNFDSREDCSELVNSI